MKDEEIRKKLIKTIGYFRSRGINQQICEEFIAYLEKHEDMSESKAYEILSKKGYVILEREDYKELCNRVEMYEKILERFENMND